MALMQSTNQQRQLCADVQEFIPPRREGGHACGSAAIGDSGSAPAGVFFFWKRNAMAVGRGPLSRWGCQESWRSKAHSDRPEDGM